MNSTFKFKLIQALNKKNANKGFTLIELLVVVIIIGVLAAISLPNLLGQVARGRQAEARTNLGAVNRARQAFRLETGTFGVYTELPLAIQGQYYSYADSSTAPNATAAVTNATAISTYNNDIRDYSAGVAQNASGQFGAIICEATTPDQASAVAATPTAGTTDGGTCANGKVLK